MLRQTSLGAVGLVVGGILTVVGFAAYFADNATLNLAGFFYGIPLLLGGLALKAAELKPIPITQATSSEVLALREQQATETQNQIRKDVTRYRYGQEAHLSDTLERLGLSPNREERPSLQGIRETIIDGSYTLILQFYSPFMPLSSWQQKQDKITQFFGPGLKVQITQPQEEQIDVALIAEG
ncbi:DUF2854 domain-containing protein [Planktothrix mougeotii]|uniref:DUF2854 domain-containing protein n=1 Tax=Planktothrix mougeotii LEGE 06226 TaxID=1828728 RepID=A0ABR9U9N1_9CYAN|nr:DUF2854 domain-containing protein [Planktothrix mougeotii]MBE9143158.1 DUF2854 domain-containing protein [Planktothrix mougeotii LEGE 06226]